MKNPDNKVHCVAVHLLCSTGPARVETLKLAYDWRPIHTKRVYVRRRT